MGFGREFTRYNGQGVGYTIFLEFLNANEYYKRETWRSVLRISKTQFHISLKFIREEFSAMSRKFKHTS